jgi:hypothetical protein
MTRSSVKIVVYSGSEAASIMALICSSVKWLTW